MSQMGEPSASPYRPSGNMGQDSAPPEAVLVALGGLPGMGPARLTALLGRFEPSALWDALKQRRRAEIISALAAVKGGAKSVERWIDAAATLDVEDVWAAHLASGVTVLTADDPRFPARLDDDPEPPALLYAQGEPSVLDGPCVALVGTRRCSRYGYDVAHDLGRDLAAAGVCVVSGLALGIDAAAHRGALDGAGAAPAAVVGTGLDVRYPRANHELWEQVAATGVVLSEAPLGTRPDRWRFPARNRVIAGLADVVVVVESHASGGSLHTVAEALERDRVVLAVPGSVRSPSASGVNQLLHDGAGPCRDVDDILVVLGLAGVGAGRGGGTRRPPPSGGDAEVLARIGWEPTSIDQLAHGGLGLGPLTATLERLVQTGWLTRTGSWYERRG